MNETINGLHSCQPANTPKEGDVKLFTVENKTGKSGKAYLKIKNSKAEDGGTPHRILSVEPTGYTDSYGNVSFNVEIEPAHDATPAQVYANTPRNAPPTSSAPRQSVPAPAGDVDSARRHIMQAANLLLLCKRAADSVLGDSCDPEDGRTLFIDATRAGFIHAMPDNKMVETRQTAEPFTPPTEYPKDGTWEKEDVPF